MTAQPDPFPALPELGLLERAVNYTRGSLAAVPGTDPRAPTPCAGWDLTDLLVHMDDSLRVIEQAGRVREVALAPDGPEPADGAAPRTATGLVAAIRDRACGLLTAWMAHRGERLITVAGSPLRAGVLVAAGALEITVHGDDLARACGADHPLPVPLASDLLAYLPLLVQPGDRPVRFAPALATPAGAPPSTRLLAQLGRPA